MFLYKRPRVHQLQQRYYAQRVAFSLRCMDKMLFNSGCLRWIGFPMNVCFSSHDLPTLRTPVFRPQKVQKRFHSIIYTETNYQSNVLCSLMVLHVPITLMILQWESLLSNAGHIHPVRSSKFRHNAASQQDEVRPHNTRALCPLLNELFPDS